MMNIAKHIKYIAMPAVAVGMVLSGCGSHNTNNAANNMISSATTGNDTATTARKVDMVISSIPFPTSILDTLHNIHAVYQSSLPNPVESISLYSQSNAQAVNLGVYGADLAYVISFEQFQQVGSYMKATKALADNVGIPMAFTQSVIQRCQQNNQNKDSLNHIVYESYSIIDKTLKDNQRKPAEALVLAGGWIEGMYLTTQSLGTLPGNENDKASAYKVIVNQGQYLDKLLVLMDGISGSPYCKSISTALHEIRAVLNEIKNPASVSNDVIKKLTDKVNDLRVMVVKGGTA